jgi:cell division septum initiation protein DivIVA
MVFLSGVTASCMVSGFLCSETTVPAMRWRLSKPDESRPTLRGLGSRVEQILSLVEQQAEQYRETARREAEEIVAAARREAEEILAAARREAHRITGGM